MQAKIMKLSELRKTDKNIRRHSKRQIQEYVRSIKMFGQIRPLVVADDGEILVGNGMYDALVEMGVKECDAYVVSGLTNAQKRKLMLADNKVYELGYTDSLELDSILVDLDGDFDVPGYSSDFLESLCATSTDVDEIVQNYGNFQIDEKAMPQDSSEQVEHWNGKSAYAPVEIDTGGNILPAKPENEDHGPKASSEAQEPTVDRDNTARSCITCPHCGGKIWL